MYTCCVYVERERGRERERERQREESMHACLHLHAWMDGWLDGWTAAYVCTQVRFTRGVRLDLVVAETAETCSYSRRLCIRPQFYEGCQGICLGFLGLCPKPRGSEYRRTIIQTGGLRWADDQEIQKPEATRPSRGLCRKSR